MLKKMYESSGNVIGFQAIGNLAKEDFVTLAEEVRAVIDNNGSARLLIDFEMYVHEKTSAWAADLKFAEKYHGTIEKLAIVGDRNSQKDIAKHAAHFYAKQTEFFSVFDRAAAWFWLKE